MEFQDKSLTCADCGAPFVFTAGEQKFYQEKGFGHEPKRCKDCRTKRKGAHDAGPPDRGYSAKGSSDGPARGARAESRGGGEFFSATCSACGGPARLSFRPSPERPVFCRSCYQARTGMGGPR